MTLIDHYAYSNRFSRIHPAEKIVLTLCMMIFSLLAREAAISITVFVISGGMILFAGIPGKFYGKLLLIPLVFIFLGLMPVTVNMTQGDISSENIIFSLSFGQWLIFIDFSSIKAAFELFFLSTGSVSCLYLLILTTPFTEILYEMKKWKVPSVLIEMMALTYRFIFVVYYHATVIRHSQTARLGYSSAGRSIFSLGALASALFLQCFQTGKKLTRAAESRGGWGEITGTGRTYSVSIRNWLYTGFVFALLLFLFLNVRGGPL